MNTFDSRQRLLVLCLMAAISVATQISTSWAQESGLVGTWRAMIGSPSNYEQVSSSVVFTTTFEENGLYRTVAVVEGGGGGNGVGGTYIMTGHYALQAPSTLVYRMENSVLCVLGNACYPSIPPGERLGAVVSIDLHFDSTGGVLANGQHWTRLQ